MGGLFKEIKIILKTAGEQIFSSFQSSKGIYFTKKFYDQAKSWGLSERDAEDAYYHGQPGTYPNQLIRTYANHKISIIYFLDKDDGKPVITSIKKFVIYKT